MAGSILRTVTNGQVFGFTHDGTGRVITIDPTTGVGRLFGTFTDPMTSKGIYGLLLASSTATRASQ